MCSTECGCGEDPQTMERLLECSLLLGPRSPDDLTVFNSCAKTCVLQWREKVCGHEERNQHISASLLELRITTNLQFLGVDIRPFLRKIIFWQE